MKRIQLLLILCAGLALSACSKDKDEPKKARETGYGISLLNEILVPEEALLKVASVDGTPLANAQVLIGERMDQPFPENFLSTDGSGQFIAPEAWDTAQMVTVAAPGHIRATFMGQIPEGQTFVLNPDVSLANYELKGKGNGFQTKDRDGFIDFAVMMPAMMRNDLFAFNINAFISPQTDRIEAAGQQLQIPSNVSLPRQSERYLIVNVTLDKPQYRMYFGTPGNKWVYTAKGQFPFKDVVNELRNNKEFFELINYFKIQGGSLKQVAVNNPSVIQDLPVNELVFNQSQAVRAPAFASDDFVIAAAAAQFQGMYFPTDVKSVTSGQTLNMTFAAGSDPYVLTVLSKRNELNSGNGRLTAAFQKNIKGTAATLLPLMTKPTVKAEDSIAIIPVAAPKGLQAAATYAALSQVEKKQQGQVVTETVQKKWEVYSLGWQQQIQLPEWPLEKPIVGIKRWESSLMATEGQISVELSPRMLNNISHATRAQTDF
jgi:hypothetical protein